jgi:PTS system cellobiose-specific IIB component
MSGRISLFCDSGMSTSLLINKMRDSAALKGKDYEIFAFPFSDFDVKAPGSDVCLLGPRTAYALPRLRQMYPDKKIAVIPAQIYGLMDGKGVLALAEKLLREE